MAKIGKMRLTFIYIAGILLVSFGILSAQPSGNGSGQLERIRKEISAFQQQLAEYEKQEKSILQNVLELDYEIELQEKLLHQLEQNEKEIADRLKNGMERIEDLDNDLAEYRRNFKDRAVHLYKYGKPNLIQHLLRSGSLSKTASLQKYYKVLLKRDERVVKAILASSEETASINHSLAEGLDARKILLQDAKKERDIVVRKKNERQKLLYTIRDDNDKVRLAVAEHKKAEKLLLDELSDIRSKNIDTSVPEISNDFARFSQRKGNLRKPVPGYVVSHIGLEKDPVTKVETVNRGVEILSDYGADVNVVCDGIIAKIKWLPWYGQTVFVRHTEGYYTVYAGLSEISVNPGEAVLTNHVIGKVGQESSNNLPKLQFQIWRGSETLDPEDWFGKTETNSFEKSSDQKKIGS